jgi:hypothetical protein
MNFGRTALLRYSANSNSDIAVDSTVNELAGFFGDGSRLRSIEKGAFRCCWRLPSIMIPSVVEVIGDEAFFACSSLREVRFETTSRLRLIGQLAFDECPDLQPVDVPSGATIFSTFTVLASIRHDDGSTRRRVRFATPPGRW